MNMVVCDGRNLLARANASATAHKKKLAHRTDVNQAMHKVGSQEARRRLGPDRDAVPTQSRELLAASVCKMGMRSISEFGSVSVDRMTYTSAGR